MHHSKTLEEIRGNHLESHERECQIDDSQAFDCKGLQFRVIGKKRYGETRDAFGHEEAGASHDRGTSHSKLVNLLYTCVFACSVIVSRNRLHSLVETHVHHHEEEGNPVHDAVGPDGKVAAVFEELLVDEHCHYAGCRMHQERSHADGQRVLCYPHVKREFPQPCRQVQEIALVQEISHGIAQGEGLAEYGCQCGTAYPHSENENEHRVENRV